MEREQLISTVKAVQNGDNVALSELFNEYYNDVYYFALRTLKDSDLASDITQENFIEIINTIGNLKEPAAFGTWIKTITYHQCTRYFKKKKDVLLSEDEDGNNLFDTLPEERAEFIPDEALDQKAFKKTILSMLDGLSEEQRSATMMYYFYELSVKQIAEIQGVSEGTVKSRLNYARKAIKASVDGYEKKHNVKLHSLSILPLFGLLKWVLDGVSEESMPAAAVKTVAKGIAGAIGAEITTAAVSGGGGISAKIISSIVAAAITIGGSTTAAVISNNNSDSADSGSAVTSTEISDTSSLNTPSNQESDSSFIAVIIPQNLPSASSSITVSAPTNDELDYHAIIDSFVSSPLNTFELSIAKAFKLESALNGYF